MASKRGGSTRKGKGSGRAAPRKAAKPASSPALERDADALAAHAGKLWRALHAKLQDRDPELASELLVVMRAHMAVMVALFGNEVAELRRDVG